MKYNCIKADLMPEAFFTSLPIGDAEISEVGHRSLKT